MNARIEGRMRIGRRYNYLRAWRICDLDANTKSADADCMRMIVLLTVKGSTDLETRCLQPIQKLLRAPRPYSGNVNGVLWGSSFARTKRFVSVPFQLQQAKFASERLSKPVKMMSELANLQPELLPVPSFPEFNFKHKFWIYKSGHCVFFFF